MATINYGNKLKLVNQYNPEKGYLDSCGHNSTKTGYGVQTSSSPDRGPGTGTWQIVRENLSSDSGPVNYGDKIKLVNQYNPEKGYLDSCGHNSTNTGYGVLTSSNPNRGPGTGTWQIVRDDLSSGSGPVNDGDKIKLVNQYNPEKGYLDSCGHNSTNTGYGVQTSSNPNRGPGTGTWQLIQITKPASLEVRMVEHYDVKYTDVGTGANQDLSVFAPRLNDGEFRIMYTASNSRNQPSFSLPVVKDLTAPGSPPALVPPQFFKCVWNDKCTGGHTDGQLWEPVPPPGYVALGHVALHNAQISPGETRSSSDVDPFFRCVHKDLVDAAGIGDLIWTDRGSGGTYDGSVWEVPSTKAFITSGPRGYARPDNNQFKLSPSSVIMKPSLVSFKSALHGEYLYAGNPMLDDDRRRVLTWGRKGDPSTDSDMHWRIEHFGDYVGIKSVLHKEWLYAGNAMLDDDRRHALTWKKAGDPKSDMDMRWIIKDFGDYVGIKSVKHNEWLYAGNAMLDGDRRHALTWGGSGNPESDKDMRWIKDSLATVIPSLAKYKIKHTPIHGASGVYLSCHNTILPGDKRGGDSQYVHV